MYKTNFKLFYSLLTLWRIDVSIVDESVIQGLLEMSFSRRSEVEKPKKRKDGQPCHPSPNLKCIHKDKRRADFHFNDQNIWGKNFRHLSLMNNQRVVCDDIHISVYQQHCHYHHHR